MKIKTSELTGPALNWAVRKTLHPGSSNEYVEARDNYSTCWNKGGPIIEREGISVLRVNPVQRNWHTHFEVPDEWAAELGACSAAVSTNHEQHDPMFQFDVGSLIYGPTPLIAAMRCYVASRLGDEVNVPNELC